MVLNSLHVALPQTAITLCHPVVDLLQSPHVGNRTQLDLKAVASLLALTVGFKPANGEGNCRWTPSGGNLGSVEAYLVAQNVQGLSAGVYLYKPQQHTLVSLNQRNVDHLPTVLAATATDNSVSALVVFVGAYGRLARKYGPFAYKLLHLDAGVASSQFLLVAAALEVLAESVTGWQSAALSAALALRPLQEVTTQVFCLAPAVQTPQKALNQSIFKCAMGTHLDEGHSPQALAELSADMLAEQLMCDSRFISARLPSRMLSRQVLGAALIGLLRTSVHKRYRTWQQPHYTNLNVKREVRPGHWEGFRRAPRRLGGLVCGRAREKRVEHHPHLTPPRP